MRPHITTQRKDEDAFSFNEENEDEAARLNIENRVGFCWGGVAGLFRGFFFPKKLGEMLFH